MIFYLNNESDLPKLGKQLREELTRTGKSLEVNFKQARSLKSKAQNSYYHCLLHLICKDTGQDFKRLRFTLKIELGYYDEVWVKGEAKQMVKSMSDVTVEQSNIFIENAITICQFLKLNYQTKEQHFREINYVQNGK